MKKMSLLSLLCKNWSLLRNLIGHDFHDRYVGSYLGVIWAFINPLLMVTIYWFVFTHGFKAVPVQDVPFALWLLAGLVPWFFLNDAISNSVQAVCSQRFLVKKMVFEVKLLPLVKIGSALLVNLFFWGFLLVVCVADDFYPQLIWLQLIYYMFCSVMLSVALSFLFSSIMPFFPDLGQIVVILMQILFFVTPIFWDQTLLTGDLMYIYLLNPFSYIITGVRETLIEQIPFWVHAKTTLYFWSITLLLYAVGNRTFNKLRHHFADVL